MVNQFKGMSSEPFTYEDFEKTRATLINTIHQNLTVQDKEFLISFSNLTPDWSVYNFKRFPAVQWKIQNLIKLKAGDLKKFSAYHTTLKEQLK
jgi:hypothetical protein